MSKRRAAAVCSACSRPSGQVPAAIQPKPVNGLTKKGSAERMSYATCTVIYGKLYCFSPIRVVVPVPHFCKTENSGHPKWEISRDTLVPPGLRRYFRERPWIEVCTRESDVKREVTPYPRLFPKGREGLVTYDRPKRLQNRSKWLYKFPRLGINLPATPPTSLSTASIHRVFDLDTMSEHLPLIYAEVLHSMPPWFDNDNFPLLIAAPRKSQGVWLQCASDDGWILESVDNPFAFEDFCSGYLAFRTSKVAGIILFDNPVVM
ncbi:hypothetical protein BT96DRAFT_1074971 [Gymnopus androsaceus JB14]|uniref:Uncharacterized protein n=1 Tax=Gymnopus androsaceus JB14 TaxID=1447944 RepID=A0A6A4GSP0_9AGAR|nr:hypothetical protein BT96DRAFT_1074971 [Gymnopus androsaceus JB14]